jgi:uncharacterized delta-60 repeat protein
MQHYIKSITTFFLFCCAATFSISAQRVYNPEGSPDPEYGTNGYAVSAGISELVAVGNVVLADGSVVLAYSNPLRTAMVVSKIQPGGHPKPTFGNEGYAVFDLPGDQIPIAAAVQPDGKLLVAGYSYEGNFFRSDFFLMRLNASGGLDPSFGSGGFAVLDFTPPGGTGVISNDRATVLAVRPDGKIVLGGVSDRYIDINVRSDSYFTFAQVSAGGALDNSFGSGGFVQIPIGANRVNGGVGTPDAYGTLDSSGRFTASVRVERQNPTVPDQYDPKVVLLRIRENGFLDADFLNGGAADFTQNQFPGSYILKEAMPCHLLVLAGQMLLRLNDDGSIDENFGNGGRVSLPQSNTFGSGIAVDAGGKIVVSATEFGTGSTGGSRGLLWRYWPNGAPDIKFGQNGRAVIDPGYRINFAIAGRFPGTYLLGLGGVPDFQQPRVLVLRLFSSRKR